ncbi:protein activator [Pseudomonas protegens]|uniref:alkane oxidation protein activator PraB n=1 Tax=Pseudomonas protegens TaxID=380021 RepID=UPI001C8D5353|nr:alkane oxidation protein activator PraB [Pseudomonas protegens]QZI67956.1 protein activator [Pseudomonas protegens]
MQSIKTLVSVASFAICLGAASMASAATIAPAGASFSAPGTISVSSPASFGIPVNCNINFSGTVAANGSSASITNATVSGSNSLCGVPVLLNLPWTLTASSATAGTVTGVNFKILSNCSSTPVTINATWNNATNTLSIPSAQSVGSCKITALSVKPNPAFTVTP